MWEGPLQELDVSSPGKIRPLGQNQKHALQAAVAAAAGFPWQTDCEGVDPKSVCKRSDPSPFAPHSGVS